MPHLIAVTGNLGAGKTTLASVLAWYYKANIEGQGGKVDLFANYDLRGATKLAVPDDWFLVAESHGSICVWDEAHRSFDSRKFSGAGQILATEILTFARKMASVHIFATPSIQRLDTRIREMIEVLIVVRKGSGKSISIDFYDYQADFAGRFGRHLKTQYIPGSKIRQIHKLQLFDTHSFVNGFPLPKTEPQIRDFMSKLEQAHNNGRYKLA